MEGVVWKKYLIVLNHKSGVVWAGLFPPQGVWDDFIDTMV
jgi:hypothetical protein